MKGGHSNERSRWSWGSLDLDRCNFGSVYFACHRFSRLYLLITWLYPPNVLMVTFYIGPAHSAGLFRSNSVYTGFTDLPFAVRAFNYIDSEE